MDTLTTGHEAEMDAEMDATRKWVAKPKAERQIDIIRARLESALEQINCVGETDLLGEVITAERAAEAAIRYMAKAIDLAGRQ